MLYTGVLSVVYLLYSICSLLYSNCTTATGINPNRSQINMYVCMYLRVNLLEPSRRIKKEFTRPWSHTGSGPLSLSITNERCRGGGQRFAASVRMLAELSMLATVVLFFLRPVVASSVFLLRAALELRRHGGMLVPRSVDDTNTEGVHVRIHPHHKWHSKQQSQCSHHRRGV
jgi:hypothetical protein